MHTDAIISVHGETTVNEILFQCAVFDVGLSDRYVREFGLSEYSCMVFCGMYNSILLLVERLSDARVHETFTRVCALIRKTATDFPMAGLILQGVAAIAWSLKFAIPPDALPYLENLGSKKDDLRDIPLAFAIPDTALVRSMLTESGDEGSADLAEMGKLLARWSAFTID